MKEKKKPYATGTEIFTPNVVKTNEIVIIDTGLSDS